jgi:hypothetical protein
MGWGRKEDRGNGNDDKEREKRVREGYTLVAWVFMKLLWPDSKDFRT